MRWWFALFSHFRSGSCWMSLSSYSSWHHDTWVWVTQSCLTLCDPKNPMDHSLPGSSVHGILQSRILKWIAIPFSRESSHPRDRTQVCCIAGKFFIIWATREAHLDIYLFFISIYHRLCILSTRLWNPWEYRCVLFTFVVPVHILCQGLKHYWIKTC